MRAHILLDIEGTTCPTSFVSDTLFPYAYAHLEDFLNRYGKNDEVQSLIEEAWNEWQSDNDPTSQELLNKVLKGNKTKIECINLYLCHLMTIDRKSSALKDLQGKIWHDGYKQGRINAELYPETAGVLRELHQQGHVLAVYSSGSIPAQQLLYRHTPDGDITALFSYWFDTRSGSKKEPKSYQNIAKSMNISVQQVVFISDSGAECDAAAEAGMPTLFSLRKGNPDQSPRHHQTIKDLKELLQRLRFVSH